VPWKNAAAKCNSQFPRHHRPKPLARSKFRRPANRLCNKSAASAAWSATKKSSSYTVRAVRRRRSANLSTWNVKRCGAGFAPDSFPSANLPRTSNESPALQRISPAALGRRMSQCHTTLRRNPPAGLSCWAQHGGAACGDVEKFDPTGSRSTSAENHTETRGDLDHQSPRPVDRRTTRTSRSTLGAMPDLLRLRKLSAEFREVSGWRKPSLAGLDEKCRAFRNRFAGALRRGY